MNYNKKSKNICRYCGKKLNGLTPCDCEKSKDKKYKKLWDKKMSIARKSLRLYYQRKLKKQNKKGKGTLSKKTKLKRIQK